MKPGQPNLFLKSKWAKFTPEQQEWNNILNYPQHLSNEWQKVEEDTAFINFDTLDYHNRKWHEVNKRP